MRAGPCSQSEGTASTPGRPRGRLSRSGAETIAALALLSGAGPREAPATGWTGERLDGIGRSGREGYGGGDLNTIGPGQSRAARGLLGWSTADLARASGLDEGFVTGFEAGTGDPASGQIEALRSALMREGVVFTGGDGVRLSDRQKGGDEGTRLGDLTTENDR